MKIVLPADADTGLALDDAVALMSYHEYLLLNAEDCLEITDQDRCGRVVLGQMQKMLIEAANELPDSNDPSKPKTVNI